VQVHEVVDGRATELHYSADDWNFGSNRFSQGPASWGTLGHAGLRVHYSLHSPAYKDELVVFLGASYFRALGRDQQYGLSARGLALDTVGGAGPEEFPRFSAFWLERPAADASAVVVHALLESPRVTGAYRFTITPGDNTAVGVQARLFLRTSAEPALATVATWGIAPLTSMYLHGENQPSAADFRPEVHDSDGLLVAATGPGAAAGAAPEWLWRPLARPGQPLVSSFAVQRLQGFGLMQRERRFSAYEDTEARYDRRPSAWVEPVGDWGPGRVELLLLPTPDETEDNVVAYWVPASPPMPGQALDMAWRVHWQGDALQQPPAGWTVQSRRGRSWAEPLPGEIKFVVDFDGPALRALPADSNVDAVATALSNARVLDSRAWRHPQGGWRMQLRVQRQDPEQPVELRAFLRHGSQTLTETWTALVPKE
jgi:glucans biosynthesis protein